MGSLTPHLVVTDADAAAKWYVAALGAVEEGRIPVPGGRLMQVALRFGDTTMMIADEFPEMGILGPLSLGSPVASISSPTMSTRRGSVPSPSAPPRRANPPTCSGATASLRLSTPSAIAESRPAHPRRTARRNRPRGGVEGVWRIDDEWLVRAFPAAAISPRYEVAYAGQGHSQNWAVVPGHAIARQLLPLALNDHEAPAILRRLSRLMTDCHFCHEWLVAVMT